MVAYFDATYFDSTYFETPSIATTLIYIPELGMVSVSINL